ncbi:MAG: (2Fe-2S)-binding protein [Nocardioides sp.]
MRPGIRLSVNGETVEIATSEDTPLLTVLRDELGLRGSRFGCGQGLCGACFVLLDGVAVPSCQTPVSQASASSGVVTVEGLSQGGTPHPVQAALLEGQAAQCGFCISGIVVRAAALLSTNPAPSADEVAEALERNLCRCGVQRRIIDAIVAAGSAP